MSERQKPDYLDALDSGELQRRLSRIPLYLRLLSFGKISIAAAVMLMVLMVVIVPLLKPEEEGLRIAIEQSDEPLSVDKPVMKNPRFESVDKDNNPYTVRAREAVQESEDTVLMRKINADIELDNDLWLALTAHAGRFQMQRQQLQLSKAVQLIANNGYELRSPEVWVDMKRGTVSSEAGVAGQGPFGKLKAERFLIESAAKRMLFTNGVQLTIFP